MIRYITKPSSDKEIFNIFHPIVKKWFKSKFKSFSEPQRYGLLNIYKGRNTFVSAVTGSGKTLTGFLIILNELIRLSEKGRLKNKVYAIYISPLRSLNNDISVNLKNPLREMEKIAGKEFGIRVGVRTGDTKISERSKMLKEAPHILITTPESLSIVLCSVKFKELLRDIKLVIIDELHSLAENKRGVHLSLSLEILQNLCKREFIRVGLGATCEPLKDLAQFLVGNARDCDVANISLNKKMDLRVLSPVPNLIDTTYEEMHKKMYSLLDRLIQEHRTTLIFTNTRSATERVVHHLKEKFPKRYLRNIGAHHGSLSRKHRLSIERRMRKGELKVIVCSTSLELGIDIGFIDLVILLGSPKSVARCSQRFGRAGHKLRDVIKGRIIVLDRDDLVECSVMLKNVLERNIDRIHIPENCLDVLAQQIYGIAISNVIHVDDLFNLVKKSYCYRNLSKEEFIQVIDYLSGKYVDLEDRHVYAKIWYDEESGMIGRKGKLSRVIYMTNVGTIPDETVVKVKLGGEIIGNLDEAFLERLNPGDVFVLGGSKYVFNYSRGMVAYVSGAEDMNVTVPSWFSEILPLNFDLALEINVFRRLIDDMFKCKESKEDIINFINNYLYVDENAANAIYEYFKEQFLFCEIPNDKKLLIEFCKDEEDNKYVVFHSLYGRRVNDVLSRAIGYTIGRLQRRDVKIGVNDNGFYITGSKVNVLKALRYLSSEDLRYVMKDAIERSEVLKRRFRHCATRSLMILREYKGKRKRVGRQQISSSILINAVKRISSEFSILKEARREVLEDLMDIKNAIKVLKKIENNKIKIKDVHNVLPSPFAFNLVLQGRVDVMRIEDKIEFLRNMHRMVLAKIGKKYKI